MSITQKINDKSLAIQISIAASLMALSGVASAASNTSLVDADGSSSYAGTTLGGKNVKGSFIDGKGGGVEGLETSMGNLTKVIVAVSALIGFGLAAFGIYILYKSSKPNSQSNPMNGFIALIAGSALAILPYIVFSGGNTLTNFAG
ncbi:MAG: hypothetical protein J6N72_06875 [Psychrobacter sp.]|nr:hypothetical protein [Psychrobacter sp.]